MGKRARGVAEEGSNGVPSRTGEARDRKENPVCAGSSLPSLRPVPQRGGPTAWCSRVQEDPELSKAAAGSGDDDDSSGFPGGRGEETMDPLYTNFLQDDSIELPWSSAPSGLNTALPADLDRSMAELDEVIALSSKKSRPRASVGSKGKKQRCKTERTKWTALEDNLLVSAWLNVSQDPIVGKDQSSESYWTRIAEYYNAYNTAECNAKSMKAMVNHWSLINECVSKFAGYLNQTDALHQSGTTERERMAQASTMYQDIEGKPFAFHHCWVLLADHPKWSSHMSLKKQKTVGGGPTHDGSNNTPVDLSSQASSQEGARPIGREAAKAARKRGGSSSASLVGVYSEHFDKLNESRSAMVEIQREKLAMSKEAENERVMKIDLNACTGLLREYYESRQRKIITSLREMDK